MEQTDNLVKCMEPMAAVESMSSAADQNVSTEELSCLFLKSLPPELVGSVYSRNPGLDCASYDIQHATLLAAHFGASHAEASVAHEPGAQAQLLIVNCQKLQEAWRRERQDAPLHADSILLEQIQRLAPQVVCLPDPFIASPELLMTLRQLVKLLATRHDSLVAPSIHPGCFDLTLSPFPQQSIPGTACYYSPLSYHHPHAASFLPFDQRSVDVSFAGELWAQHTKKQRLLEYLARTTPILFWGDGVEVLAPNSPIHPRYRGLAGGDELRKILGHSRIAVNRHADDDRCAWNRRLFEATGAGALLITDHHDNLCDLFAVGKEIVTYRTPAECRELIDYYHGHPDEAEAIARAGQARTLRDHTFARRIGEAVATFRQHLALVEAA